VQLRDQVRAFLDHALALGADRIATGHYAQVREWTNDGRTEFQLLKAEDGTKDQSYFLYRLNQAQLSKTLFPLGGLYKREVRKMAEAAGLHVFDKKDSTGICFIGERPFREFLSRYLPAKPGEIRTLEGDKVIGQHQGLMHHTIGQRKGLLIGGLKGNQDEAGEHDAWYVAQKDVAKNVLYVVQSHDHPALLKDRLFATELSWVSGRDPRTHWVYRQAALPHAGCALRDRCAGRRPRRDRLRPAPVGGDAGAERGDLREQGVPGRRHHRGPVRQTTGAAAPVFAAEARG
jgi:tRNA-specific 2-thiouridylase